MEIKVNRHPRNTFSSILRAGIISVALVIFSSSGAKGEAASNLLGRFSCSQAKELIETTRTQHMKPVPAKGVYTIKVFVKYKELLAEKSIK